MGLPIESLLSEARQFNGCNTFLLMDWLGLSPDDTLIVDNPDIFTGTSEETLQIGDWFIRDHFGAFFIIPNKDFRKMTIPLNSLNII